MYNKHTIIGNLGSDPEVRYTASGDAVCNFRVATNESWTNKQGQKVTDTQWHRITVWRGLAEVCGQHLAKGRQVLVEGKSKTRQWTDRDGQTRYTTEIHADKVVFLGNRPAQRSEQRAEEHEAEQPAPSEEAQQLLADDDVPFA